MTEPRPRAPCPGRAHVLSSLAQSRDEGWCVFPFLWVRLGQAQTSLEISFSVSLGQG